MVTTASAIPIAVALQIQSIQLPHPANPLAVPVGGAGGGGGVPAAGGGANSLIAAMNQAIIQPFKNMFTNMWQLISNPMVLSVAALAVGILALTSIVSTAVQNSKILQTVFGTVGKALGLLVDVILMPFLPLIALGLLKLFEGIMAFKTSWDDAIKDPAKFIIDSFVKTSILTPMGMPLWLVGLLNAIFVDKMKESGFNINLGIGKAAESIGDLLWGVLNFLFGVATLPVDVIQFGLNILPSVVYNFLVWVWNTLTGGEVQSLPIDFKASGLDEILAKLREIQRVYEIITNTGRLKLEPGTYNPIPSHWANTPENAPMMDWNILNVDENSKMVRGG